MRQAVMLRRPLAGPRIGPMGKGRTRAASGNAARLARRLARVPVVRGVVGLLGSRRYVVRGDSMRPGFEPEHYLLVSRTAYSSSLPKRGDVVIVRGLGGSRKGYLKRVVGLPGETVAVVDGTLIVDGEHIREPYLAGLPATLGLENREWILGIREVFIMGDNRSHSTDSRELGPVDLSLIVGKVFFRYWPLPEFGGVR